MSQPTEPQTEAAGKADFAQIRYGQVWEDADILIEALRPPAGGTCLSIASAGDNALALLTTGVDHVHAIDLNPAQLHCLALRVAAFKTLEHDELLALIGSRPSDDRPALYRKCRGELDTEAKAFWDARPDSIRQGIGEAGKFERYFRLFRRRILPLIHSKARIDSLLSSRNPAGRRQFYDRTWNTWRWRLLFRLFFSRWVMGRLGRDPAFFDYVEGSVADRILARTEHALTELNPAENPYLQWILKGTHLTALPCYLRPENFNLIRERIDRIEWHLTSIEAFAQRLGSPKVDSFNLSDIFEYMSEANTQQLLQHLASVARPGARLAYWNMLVPRERPESLADQLIPCPSEAAALFQQDKAFFYSRLVIETIPEQQP
ncbi:MAG: DUF3419 family protein [Opitutales bacterium]|nr:DUF3419 family protein [Opitutales bacterium]MCH8540448.1 BtaA family protein [Opitutales bacterium]